MNLTTILEADQAVSNKVTIDEQLGVCILDLGYKYELDLDRIRNERDLLKWVHHLSKKVGMSIEMVPFFIDKVARFKNLDATL